MTDLGRLDERFRAKITVSGECWEWTGSRWAGYGRFWLDGTYVYAHRYSYEVSIGPIPEEMEIDHLCGNPPCVNPGHLEPVTHQENVLRGNSPSAVHAQKTHCPRGHPYSGDNLYIKPKGGRECRACKRRRYREWARRG